MDLELKYPASNHQHKEAAVPLEKATVQFGQRLRNQPPARRGGGNTGSIQCREASRRPHMKGRRQKNRPPSPAVGPAQPRLRPRSRQRRGQELRQSSCGGRCEDSVGKGLGEQHGGRRRRRRSVGGRRRAEAGRRPLRGGRRRETQRAAAAPLTWSSAESSPPPVSAGGGVW